MKRVILIRPHYGIRPESRARPLPYLGHIAVAAALQRAGHEVSVIDEPGGDALRPRLSAEIGDALFVGLSAMTVQVPAALAAARLARELRPDVPLVWGGIHPTLFPEQTCDGRHADVVVVGEGDETAVELAAALAAGSDLAAVRGIAFRRAGQVVRTGPRPPLAMDELARPAYELIDETAWRRMGQPTEFTPGFSTFVAAGRGCPYRCSFCVNTVLPATSRRHRPRSPELILADVAWLQRRYGVETLLLQDEDFFTSRRRLARFLSGVEAGGPPFAWQAAARANYFHPGYLNPEMLARLARAGCVSLGIGAESGSEQVLGILLKDLDPADVRRAVEYLAGTSITAVLSYMIGVPGERPADIRRTLAEISHLARAGGRMYIGGPYVYRPYPGSRLYDEAVRQGLHVPGSLEGWAEALMTEEGSLADLDYPWISDRRLVAYATTMVPFLFTGKRGRGAGLVSRAGRLLQRSLTALLSARVESGIYAGLAEDRLLRLALALR